MNSSSLCNKLTCGQKYCKYVCVLTLHFMHMTFTPQHCSSSEMFQCGVFSHLARFRFAVTCSAL